MIGFVYKWTDAKRDMYYIGSHKGSIDDGYVCSSKWMMRAFNKRPHNFVREILGVVTTNYSDLIQLEQHYLNLIPDDAIGKSCYNLKKTAAGGNGFGYHLTEEHRKRIAESRMGEKNWVKRPEVRAKISKTMSLVLRTEESNRKRSETMTGMVGTWSGKDLSEEHKNNISKSLKGRRPSEATISAAVAFHTGAKRSDKTKIRLRESHLGKIQPQLICPHCGKVGGLSGMKQHHFDNCEATKYIQAEPAAPPKPEVVLFGQGQ